MSVSFIEPDLQKLRLEQRALQKTNSVILDEDEIITNNDKIQESETPAIIVVDHADLKKANNNKASLSPNYTTLSNTHSNALTFRRLSTSSFDTTKTASSSINESHHDNPYKKRISFDTSTDDFSSYSICCKHVQHETNYWSRTFLLSLNKSYKKSLRWLLDNVLEDGDDLICLKYEHERDKAEELLREIVDIIKTSKLKIKIIIEIALSGSIKSIVKRTMMLYQPALVVVSTTTKTYSNVMRYMTRRKTLSNYLLNHSPVPVIVVIADHLKKEEQQEPEIGPTTTISTASTLTGEDYLNHLINREIVDSKEASSQQSTTGYKSLFQTLTSSENAEPVPHQQLSPSSTTQQSGPESNFSSTNSSGSPPPPSITTPTTTNTSSSSPTKKKSIKSWSKFIPKGFRRFSS
jgi:hypothetical protein